VPSVSKPRLLIDECVNAKIILPPFLSLADCVFAKVVMRGAGDVDVLAFARQQGRILLTEDAGFGRLVFARRLPPPPGVILVTMPNRSDDERSARVMTEATLALAEADGAFVVIDFEGRRVRPFPP
jgi:predicted nuclease of predicted toxin-antitoxin system